MEEGNVAKTDFRAIGKKAAQQNLEFAKKSIEQFDSLSDTDDWKKIQLSKGVRYRLEPFGMHILHSNGQVLALDQDGTNVFNKIVSSIEIDNFDTSVFKDYSLNEIRYFIQQGLKIGIFNKKSDMEDLN